MLLARWVSEMGSALTLVALVIVVGFGILTGLHWRNRGAPHFILGGLPLALLFLTVPVIPALQQMIRGFVQIASTGVGGDEQIRQMAVTTARQLSVVVAAFLTAMLSLGALQGLAPRNHRGAASASASGSPSSPAMSWGWELVASSLLVIPAGVLIYWDERIIRIFVLMVAGNGTPSSAEIDAIARAVLGGSGHADEIIGNQLVLGVTGALTLIPLLLIASLANILIIGLRKPSPVMKYSWLVFAAASLASVWALIELSMDARWFGPAA